MGKRKLSKPFNLSKYCRRHIALHIGYIGSAYCGFARQKHIKNTVEFHLFNALLKSCLIDNIESCNYSRCGRTDKGVSALGQIVSLTVRSSLSFNYLPSNSSYPPVDSSNSINEANEELNFPLILNRLLPTDIFILGWSDCPNHEFQARFKAETRTYRYFFIKRDLNVNLMIKACSYLKGVHDFRNFCKIDERRMKSFVREIYSIKIEPISLVNNNDLHYFEVIGSAFLWHQIRFIVSILFLVGRELERPEIIVDLLNINKYPAKPVFLMSSERPLVLFASDYSSSLKFNYSTVNLQRVFTALQKRRKELLFELTMVNTALNEVKKVNNEGESELIDVTVDYEEGDIDKSDYLEISKRYCCSSYQEKLLKQHNKQ